ncbi:MAG: hypothetical protein MUP90_08310, partial [Gammaproteobacteria bacterium]|nr:hypothetical protein [Gammaproteobacteria bacterium]
LNPQLKNAGFRIRYVNFSREPEARPSLDGYSGLVVLGGPMGACQTDRHPWGRQAQPGRDSRPDSAGLRVRG